MIQPVNSAERYLNLICFPWTCQRSTREKIAVWAAFFFVGWICYPLYAVNRVYQWLKVKGTVNTVANRILFNDLISQGLNRFNNTHVRGQVNGIYITTNETNLAATRQFMRDHPRPPQNISTVHIGCATWHNLDIMCERKSTYGLIIDFNPKNREFIEKTIELVNTYETREAFKQAMINYLNSLQGEERGLFFHWDQQGLPIDRIEAELTREGSWLQSEENYRYIKDQIVARGRLIPITEDITHSENFSHIRRFLDTNNITVDTLYMSNICNFMNTSSSKNAFATSVRHLLHPETLFINCPKLRQLNIILHQQPLLGREVDDTLLFERV